MGLKRHRGETIVKAWFYHGKRRPWPFGLDRFPGGSAVGPENLVGRQYQHNKGQSWCTGTSLRDAGVTMGQFADLGDAHCADGEQELPGLENEVHG
jgi:hypothetical protein